jgi:hypothetical protein
MQDLVRQSMREGAFGLSTGLFYVPGTFARTDEVVALARVVGEMGGIHVSHMRDEARGVVASVRETIAIGEEGRLPTQVTHHKTIGRAAWGQSAETLRLVEEARRRGVDVTIDQYPYTASSTALSAALFPAWALEGGAEAVKKRIASPADRARIRETVVEKIRNERGGGDAGNIGIAACGFDPSLEGKSLARIATERGLPPTVENAADLAIDDVLPRGPPGPRGPGPRAARNEGRPRRSRPRDGPRSRDLRRAAPVRGGRQPGAGQRPGGAGRGGNDRRRSRPRPARPGGRARVTLTPRRPAVAYWRACGPPVWRSRSTGR